MFSKKILIHLSITIILSTLIRIYLCSIHGPAYLGDSNEYIEVINNIYHGYGFSKLDIVEKKIMPYSNKMPIFFYVVAYMSYIFTNNIELNVFLLNTLSLIIIIILTFKIAYIITKNEDYSILTSYFLALNPNMIFNSISIMSDTFYSMIIIIFTYILVLSIKENKKYLFFISGLLLGTTVLTRAVLKFYWIILVLSFFIFLNIRFKEKIRISLIFLTGYFLIILPYHIRNYIKLNTFSPLEFHQGIAGVWPIIPLIKDTDYLGLTKKYPKIDEIANFLKEYDIPPERKIMKKFRLNSVDINKYLTAISINTILQNPFGYLKIYIRNLLNTLSSQSSTLRIIDIFKPGFDEKQHKEFIKFMKDKKITYYVAINITLRIITFSIIALSIYGIISFIKTNYIIGIFLLIFLSYTILFSSLTLSYDRYRMPVEFIISIFFIHLIFNILRKKIIINTKIF